MKIQTILPTDATLVFQAEKLLQQAFGDSPQEAAEEVQLLLQPERILLGAVEGECLLGLVGAIPQYSHAWELHPLAVLDSERSKGIGRALTTALEQTLSERGVLTIYLGSDDEEDKTSLSDSDLFEHTFEKIEQIENRKRHPYEFYQKCGYQIVGVIPDANGRNKPDIWMAKRIANQ